MRIPTKLSINNTSFSFFGCVTEEMKGKFYSGSLNIELKMCLIEKSLPVSRNKKFVYERQEVQLYIHALLNIVALLHT